MSWRVWSVSTLDWSTRIRVRPDTFPWGRVLNGGKAGQATFKLGDTKVRESANTTTLAPWERMLVAEFQGLILYAGFITATDYDHDTQTFTVDHEDLWSLMQRRIVANPVGDGMQAETNVLVYTGVSNANLVKQAIFEGQNDYAQFNLPIVLPSDESGPVSKTIYGYHVLSVADLLKEFMGTEGGPDVDFFPRWYGQNQFQWLLRIGPLADGKWSWDASAAETTVSGLKERRDGARMANRIIAVGEGSEAAMLLKVVDGSATSPFLPIDAVASYKEESDPARLAAQARADLVTRSKPTVQVSMNVGMNEDFAAHQLRLGGTVGWKTQGSPYWADGWKYSRLIEFSGDLTDRVHLEFQTAGG